MKSRSGIISIIAFGLCCQFAHALSLKEYFEDISGRAQPATELGAKAYLNGAAQGMIALNEVTYAKFGKRVFCPPRNLGFGYQELTSAITSLLNANPNSKEKYADYPVETVGLFSLQYVYPCNE